MWWQRWKLAGCVSVILVHNRLSCKYTSSDAMTLFKIIFNWRSQIFTQMHTSTGMLHKHKHAYTHAHTHTEREKERERGGERDGERQ